MKTRLGKPLLFCAAVLLVSVAINMFVIPTAHTQTPSGNKFGHLVINGGPSLFFIFDTKTGDMWAYGAKPSDRLGPDSFVIQYYGRLEELGKPPVWH
jgi:hypothetical protein